MFLQKTIVFRLGAKDFAWTKVLGIFLAIIAVLMLINSAAVMFDSWQSVRDFNKCADSYAENVFAAQDSGNSANLIASELSYQGCKTALYQVTGAQIPGTQISMTDRQAATALTGPIAEFFAWAVVFMFALFLVLSKAVAIPIEEIESASRSFRRK